MRFFRYKRLFDSLRGVAIKCFYVTLGTFRSPLTPLKKGGTVIKVSVFRELHKKDELLAAALRYPILWDGHLARPCIFINYGKINYTSPRH